MVCHTEQHNRRPCAAGAAIMVQCSAGAVLYRVPGSPGHRTPNAVAHALTSHTEAHHALRPTITYLSQGNRRACCRTLQSTVHTTVRHRVATQSIARSIAVQVRLIRASQGIVYVSCRHHGEYPRSSPRIAEHYVHVALQGIPLRTHTRRCLMPSLREILH